jgi:uncharacterized protein YrrD
MAIFNGQEATLLGFQVAKKGVIKKFAGVYFVDLIDITKQEVVVENEQALLANLREFDDAHKNFGAVVGVTAVTESGQRLGRVADLYLDITTGAITRFYLRNLLQERIIPREYLVAITPKRIVFKDITHELVAFEKAVQNASS